MHLSTSVRDGLSIMRLQGSLQFDSRTVFRPAAKTALTDSSISEIQIRMDAVDYIDSAGLGMLLLTKEEAKKAGTRLSLVGARGTVAQILVIAKLDDRGEPPLSAAIRA